MAEGASSSNFVQRCIVPFREADEWDREHSSQAGCHTSRCKSLPRIWCQVFSKSQALQCIEKTYFVMGKAPVTRSKSCPWGRKDDQVFSSLWLQTWACTIHLEANPNLLIQSSGQEKPKPANSQNPTQTPKKHPTNETTKNNGKVFHGEWNHKVCTCKNNLKNTFLHRYTYFFVLWN